jgi:hypothetical protein
VTALVPERGSSRQYGLGFWAVALTFLTLGAFTTVPSPLYALYQVRDGLSEFEVTVIYAAYAIGVIGALALAGHLSGLLAFEWVARCLGSASEWHGGRPGRSRGLAKAAACRSFSPSVPWLRIAAAAGPPTRARAAGCATSSPALSAATLPISGSFLSLLGRSQPLKRPERPY